MRFTLLFFLALGSITAFAQEADTTRLVDQLFFNYNNSTPGVAVAVARGNKIIYERAFGLADLDHTVPNTTATIFESGSVAKQFTAMSILLLAKEGKISLQDDIRKYIPELPVYESPIRIQHLLNHTSGLKDWGSVGAISGWPRTTRVYTQAMALQIMARQTSLNYKPGEEYLYSNANYTCQVTIVERVSGKSLAEFTRDRLFEPLAMKDTQWRDNFREVVPQRAIAYSGQHGKYLQNMPFENIHGHGGLLTTVGDLIKWNQLLETHAIGGQDVYNWRVQNGKLNDGTAIDYAAGLNVRPYNGIAEIAHSGSTAGYRAWLAYYPKQKLSVVVLSNHAATNAPALGYKIADIFFGKPAPMKPGKKHINLTAAQANLWSGIYRSETSFDVVTLIAKGNQVFDGDHEVPAYHADTLDLDGERWVRTSEQTITYLNGNRRLAYTRMEPFTSNANALNNYTGTFKSIEADDTWVLVVNDNKLSIKHGAFDPISLMPVFKDAFQMNGDDLVEFKRDKSGKVTGLELSVSRAERISFSKDKK
jgi:CubicO group peptidase (beta-lactamase class C family)